MAKFNVDALKQRLQVRGMDIDTPNGVIVTNIGINPRNKKQVSIEASVPGRHGDIQREISIKVDEVNRGKIPDSVVVNILNRLAN